MCDDDCYLLECQWDGDDCADHSCAEDNEGDVICASPEPEVSPPPPPPPCRNEESDKKCAKTKKCGNSSGGPNRSSCRDKTWCQENCYKFCSEKLTETGQQC